MKKDWKVLQPDKNAVIKLSKALKCNPVTASILVNRGMDSPAEAAAFLTPALNHIRPPLSIKDMDTAVRRIYAAITGNEKIWIFGDYDVDGVTATTILYEFFCRIGVAVSYFIPHRIKEGYGIQVDHIHGLARSNGINLIITADCGSTNHEAVQAANRIGIDVIITDHHRISKPLPPAHAVINPNRADCPSGAGHLAGVGVAFCLLISLRKHLRDMHFWDSRPEPNLKHVCDLVALGTVADLVPLTRENRIFTAVGLEVIQSSERPGIQALIELCGLKGRAIEAEDIAYRLAPRLNAAGRMGYAKEAMELLTTTRRETARKKAEMLNKMNIERQQTEKKIFEEIDESLGHHPELRHSQALVLSHPEWHLGVLGIVASKLAEKYYRPVVLISTKDGEGKGSARSIPGFNLYKGLLACAADLQRFGGHSSAAGLKIKIRHLEAFKHHFQQTVQQMTNPDDFRPKMIIDQLLDFDDISDDLINELESLKPHGAGNPRPLFMTRNVDVLSSRIVGENHRQMQLRQRGGGNTFRAIQFNINTRLPLRDRFARIAFRLAWNHWGGGKRPQMIIDETDALVR